jgi:hypothetical protein
LIAHGDDGLRCGQHLFGFVETDVEELDQIIDRGIGQAFDVVDAMLSQRLSLLRVDAFNCR